HAADCKSAYAGSIPTQASNTTSRNTPQHHETPPKAGFFVTKWLIDVAGRRWSYSNFGVGLGVEAIPVGGVAPKPEPISPSVVVNAKPKAKPSRLADGGGLFLLVNPSGSRWWRWKYRRPDSGKENLLSLGTFPDVSLKRAREKRDEARKLLADGIDPGAQRVAQRRAGEARAANSFEVIAREWLTKKSPEWTEETKKRATAWLENNVFPVIGRRPIAELEYDAPALLDMLNRMVKRGAVDSAHRVREHVGAVFRFRHRDRPGQARCSPTSRPPLHARRVGDETTTAGWQSIRSSRAVSHPVSPAPAALAGASCSPTWRYPKSSAAISAPFAGTRARHLDS
ncbi:MAG TPA: integrase arm-type DNA-binding domain-containing protein, partial [Pseudoxanthomonas sp.]|nr:integrase arm-type DNA-binding domain-containing protein [Pseudoxanthomonas sp.]